MLKDTLWSAYGAIWPVVLRHIFIASKRHYRAVDYWRIFHHDRQVQSEEYQGRARYPRCQHGRRVATLYQGRPLCDCAGVEAAAAIGQMCKGVKSGT